MELEWFLRGLFFVLGAMIGSFLNVCIVRMPLEQSVVMPGSHCMKCGKAVRWFDNIPILSYFILGGKCRDCGVKFSWRYAGIEFLSACLFLGFFLYYGLTWLLLPYLVLVSLFIVATFVDFEYRIIPDELSLFGIPAALFLTLFIPVLHPVRSTAELQTGWVIAVSLVGVSLLLMIIDALRRKVKFACDEQMLIVVITGILLLQGALIRFPWEAGTYTNSILSLCAALQGVIIGGGSLFLMGMAGAMIINKRVVTLIDLKVVSEDPEGLFKELIAQGYINDEGDIQKKFTGLSSKDGFTLSGSWTKDQDLVYEMIVSCNEGGVMGGGDVKLLALIGAFLGWKLVLVSFFVAPFFGAVVGIAEKIRTKSSAIAFGPYLVLGALVSMFWGEKIVRWFLGCYGFY